MFGFGSKNTISPQEAKQRMDKGGSFVLLDVRSQDEYREARIKGAKLIPVDELAFRAANELPDKNIPILVYCHSGMRAGSAVKMLERMGYTNVASFGGIADWPYETIAG